MVNAAECVGEIVNTAGVGPFEGYYNNSAATEKTTRFGWYWSGDLGYKDAQGYLYSKPIPRDLMVEQLSNNLGSQEARS